MKTLFYHGITLDGKRFTLAGTIGKDSAESDILNVGIAICGQNEQFVKKVGRAKAEGRMRSHNGKGHLSYDLYTDKFDSFKTGTEIAGFKENWFVGMDISILMYIGTTLSKCDSRELKKEFGLYH